MWPFSNWGLSSPEAGAVLWTGFVAAFVAVWGIVSQRRIMRRAATLTHFTQIESDRDLIRARNIFAELTKKPSDLIALLDAVPTPHENGAALHTNGDKAVGSAQPHSTPAPGPSTDHSDKGGPISECCKCCKHKPALEMADCDQFEPSSYSELSVETKIHALRTVFNSNELLAIGVQMEIIDYSLFKRYCKSLFVQDWDHAAPLIFSLRRRREQPSMYHEFEEVSRWLRDNKMPRRRRSFGLWF